MRKRSRPTRGGPAKSSDDSGSFQNDAQFQGADRHINMLADARHLTVHLLHLRTFFLFIRPSFKITLISISPERRRRKQQSLERDDSYHLPEPPLTPLICGVLSARICSRQPKTKRTSGRRRGRQRSRRRGKEEITSCQHQPSLAVI